MEIDISNLHEKISTLFKKYGVKSVTLDDIAREFGMSKKTLHLSARTCYFYLLIRSFKNSSQP
ncbi:MAG: hypothetical protein DRH93_15425 [Deltaproteobacteria bacterium]|nr:MAG: hypothetical protein DRH93_15425 [Deltaproteobacteria bacterium]